MMTITTIDSASVKPCVVVRRSSLVRNELRVTSRE
jgi:hypothetical protein